MKKDFNLFLPEGDVVSNLITSETSRRLTIGINAETQHLAANRHVKRHKLPNCQQNRIY